MFQGGYAAYAFLALALLSVGVVIALRGRSKPHRMFVGFIVFIIAWMTANFFENDANFSSFARARLLEIDFATALVSGYFFWGFARNFPRLADRRRWLEWAIIPAVVFFVVLSFTTLVASRIYFETGTIRFDFGSLFPVYGALLSGFFFAGLIALSLRLRYANPVERRQIIFVLAGFTLSVIIGLTMNLFLQNFVTVDIFRLGVYGLVFIVAGMAYAILKHHLFDIKIIATEALSFFLTSALLVLVVQSRSPDELFLRLFLFVLVLILLIMLIRSVIDEVRRREEKALLAEKLAEVSEMKSNFVSIASHQLRAPIGGVRSYLAMIHDGDFGRIPPKLRKTIELNLDVLDHTLHVIEMFLDVTKMEAGKIELSPKPADLREIAEGVGKELAFSVERKGLALRLSMPKTLPTVAVDPEKMRNVIFNLVENAIKYTESGTITLALRRVNGEIECRVTDTGIGIEKEEIPKLFAKFARAGGGFKVSHGSGLGLYIIKTLVEAHGGRVFVQSPGLGRGSTFGFRIPLRRRL